MSFYKSKDNLVCFVSGVSTLSNLKFSVVSHFLRDAVEKGTMTVPLLMWLLFGAVLVLIPAVMVAFLEPVAAGSGIPQIKCYLNGVKIPRVVRIQTLICKAVGVMFSVAGGLAIGKEGPMIHSGAVIAAGISQGASKSLNFDCKVFEYFRHDHEKRDFVSGGAAAGVAAAFGSPVGGVLFSLEEGASFWNQALTWRVLFSAMISTFTLNFALSWYHGHFGQLSYPSLVNFGVFNGRPYNWYELPIFCVMGAIGGLLGALFNAVNYRITIFRLKYLHRPIVKVLEAIVVAILSAGCCFTLLYWCTTCTADTGILSAEEKTSGLQMYCNDGEFNVMSTLTFVTPEAAVKGLFHSPGGTFSIPILLCFALVYYILACWTYGLSVPSGLFIPSILIGAAWGRAVGIMLESFVGHAMWVDAGKYAFMGAAANLGGVVRMTISLTVILMEATQSVTYGLPLMLILMTAKFVGDIFNEGIYDLHIHIQSVPILGWEPPQLAHQVKARQVMNSPAVTLKPVETVDNLYYTLKNPNVRHSGFPVTQQYTSHLHGLILRDHLLILLQKKIFKELQSEGDSEETLKVKDLRDVYPRFPTIDDIDESIVGKNYTINLTPYMNPAPYSVADGSSLNKVFTLFRALGLRHLTVVNGYNEVVGMVTRKDLARFKSKEKNSVLQLQELNYTRN